MSDYSQGPDWWLASDGKWYPPQSRPMMPTPYVKPPGLSPALTGWMQGLFWAAAAVSAIGALMVFALAGASINFQNDPGLDTLASWSDLEDAASGWSNVTGVIAVVVFVLIVIWSFQAHKASASVEPTGRTWQRGWSVGGWFIPFANAVIPFLVISETQKIGVAQRRNGVVDPNWRQTSRPSALGIVWWVVFVAAFTIGGLAGALQPSGDALQADILLNDLGSYQASQLFASFGLALRVVSAVLGALFVRSIGRTLSPSGLAVRDTVAHFTAAPLPPPPNTPPPPAWPN